MPQAPVHAQHRRRRPSRPRLGWPLVMCLLVVTACAAVVAAAWYLGGRAAGQVSSVEALTTSRQDGGSSSTEPRAEGAETSSPQASDDAAASPDPGAADIGGSAAAEDPEAPGNSGGAAGSLPQPTSSTLPGASDAPQGDGAGLSGGSASSSGSALSSTTSPAAGLPVGLQDSQRPQGRVTTLPGAVERMPVRSVPLDQLTTVHRLGWNVGELHGFGQAMQADDAVTGRADGVRTVQVHHTDGEHEITVAETRPADESTALRPLTEKLADILDLDAVERERTTLPTGDECTIYRSDSEDRWTAAVDAGSVQYVITSDLAESSVADVADWVMTTDRSRLQQMPSSPDAAERLERGFRSMLGWVD